MLLLWCLLVLTGAYHVNSLCIPHCSRLASTVLGATRKEIDLLKVQIANADALIYGLQQRIITQEQLIKTQEQLIKSKEVLYSMTCKRFQSRIESLNHDLLKATKKRTVEQSRSAVHNDEKQGEPGQLNVNAVGGQMDDKFSFGGMINALHDDEKQGKTDQLDVNAVGGQKDDKFSFGGMINALYEDAGKGDDHRSADTVEIDQGRLTPEQVKLATLLCEAYPVPYTIYNSSSPMYKIWADYDGDTVDDD